MIWVDFLLIGLFVVSAIFGLMRGMFKEVLSLVTWVLAYVVSQSFAPRLDALLQPYMAEIPSIRAPLAWGVLFVCSILVGSLVQRLILELVRATGLSGSDRALGAIFGLLRALVIVVLLLTFLPLLIDFSQDAWWQQSLLIPIFESLQQSVMTSVNDFVAFVQGINLS